MEDRAEGGRRRLAVMLQEEAGSLVVAVEPGGSRVPWNAGSSADCPGEQPGLAGGLRELVAGRSLVRGSTLIRTGLPTRDGRKQSDFWPVGTIFKSPPEGAPLPPLSAPSLCAGFGLLWESGRAATQLNLKARLCPGCRHCRTRWGAGAQGLSPSE